MQIAIVVLLGIVVAQLAFIILVLQSNGGYIRDFLVEMSASLRAISDTLTEMRKDAAYVWKQSQGQRDA